MAQRNGSKDLPGSWASPLMPVLKRSKLIGSWRATWHPDAQPGQTRPPANGLAVSEAHNAVGSGQAQSTICPAACPPAAGSAAVGSTAAGGGPVARVGGDGAELNLNDLLDAASRTGGTNYR